MSAMDGFEEFFYTLFGVIAVILIVYLVLFLVSYVLKAKALSRMARNAGMDSTFLAWIPVANNYLLGSLCDRASVYHAGKKWNFAVLLVVLDALKVVTGSSVTQLEDSFQYNYHTGISLDWSPYGLLKTALGLGILVFTAIALYHLYRDYAPGQEVLFTVLSVLFGGLGQSIILFVIRDRVPLSASASMNQPPYGSYGPGYPGQPPYQGGPGTTGGWGQQPPYQGGPGTTGGWDQQPPYRGGLGTTGGWDQQPPYQGGPGTTGGWNQQPPYQGGPGTTGGWDQQPPYQGGPGTTSSWSQPSGPNPPSSQQASPPPSPQGEENGQDPSDHNQP